MSISESKLSKDRDQIILKFDELIGKAVELRKIIDERGSPMPADKYFALKASSVNLLERLSSDQSIYVREVVDSPSRGTANPDLFKGVLEAARTDYLQGFMANNKLLISAEVFSDLLVQAEVLLDHDYKDAAAVIIRAVLEDGIRKLCDAHTIEAGKRDTIQQLNEKLYKEHAYTALVHKEIIAKAEVGNCAAHGRFDQYKKDDVVAFLEFVLRFFAQYLK
jgi:hypothetical protein